MKLFSKVRLVGLVLLAVIFGGGRAAALTTNAPAISSGFLLSASNLTTTLTTTNVYFTNNTVTTFITVSNASVYVPLSITYVTNEFSGAVTFEGIVSNSFSANLTVVDEGNNTFVFSLQNVTTNPVAQIIFDWLPLVTGPVTNAIEVAISTATNNASTNLVVNQVFAGNASLVVSNYFISQAYITNYWVITNDWVTYGVSVTNLGPQNATGVMLTNTLPAGVTLVSASPGYTSSGSNLIFAVGTLIEGGSASYQFTVKPTTNGAYSLSSGAGASGTFDVNPTNEVAVENLYVTNYLSDSTLVGGTISPQKVNPQNGLIEQVVQIQNTGKGVVQAVRVVVAGLTNQLYNASGTNASGTNSGQAFVVYPIPLTNGTSVSLRLQYAPRLPFPFTNSQLLVYEVPATILNYAPRPAASFYTYSTNSLDFYRILPQSDGDMLLEFLNAGGSSFTIIYSSSPTFSNPMIATPAISSTANRIQWLDYGPPATVSAPTNTGSRYYRVQMNP